MLNPCSKSTIQTKVATRKARVQRTLERMRMPEFWILYEEKGGIVQHGVAQMKNGTQLHSFSNSSRRLFRHTTTVLPSCVSTPSVSGTMPNKDATAMTTTLPSEMTRFC